MQAVKTTGLTKQYPQLTAVDGLDLNIAQGELFSLLGDPYTYYMDAEQYAGFLSSMGEDQTLVGIGVMVELTNQGILILEALPGSPAGYAFSRRFPA